MQRPRTIGLDVVTSEIRRAEDIAPVFEALKGRADALYVCADPLLTTNRIQINILAVGARLPTMHGFREYVEAGGLMSYGPNFPDLLRRAADYVDKILRGAKPADMPVEQPTKFDLVINLTTAKALGLTIPRIVPAPRAERGDRMKRREFITLLGGAAAWPLAARAQQGERMRRIGVLMPSAADDPEFQARMTAFVQGLAQLGWTRRPQRPYRYALGRADADRIRKYAAELLALAPDVILANSSAALAPLLQATRTVPIVFTTVADPVGAGYVDSLARPGGNATGFLVWEYSIAAKWLELLKEIAPQRDAGYGFSTVCHRGRTGRVRRHPSCGAFPRRGLARGRCARCPRDRARRHNLRAGFEWRPDRDGEPGGANLIAR